MIKIYCGISDFLKEKLEKQEIIIDNRRLINGKIIFRARLNGKMLASSDKNEQLEEFIIKSIEKANPNERELISANFEPSKEFNFVLVRNKIKKEVWDIPL